MAALNETELGRADAEQEAHDKPNNIEEYIIINDEYSLELEHDYEAQGFNRMYPKRPLL